MHTASTPAPAAYSRFRYDGPGGLARIGLIYIDSSVVMEEEMWAMSGPGVSTHTARIKLPKVTVQGIEEMICVTHEIGFARKVADSCVFMERGEIIETEPAEQFFASPRSERLRNFLQQVL